MIQLRCSPLLPCLLLACGPEIDPTGTGSTGEDDTTAQTTSQTTVAITTMNVDSTSDDTTGVPPDPSTTAQDSTSETGTTAGDSSESGAASTGEMGNGECADHSECASLYCRQYQDAPPDPESLCQDAPLGGNTRFTGTVLDLLTLQPVAGASFSVASALQAATNPQGATAIVADTADGDGRVDVTSNRPVMAQIGVVALVDAAGSHLTLTGVAAPDFEGNYDAGNSVHDLWLVSAATLTTWSATLDTQTAVPSTALPLGDQGGAAIIVRDAVTGDPVVGATAESTDNPSSAFIVYPTADGTGVQASTSDSGVALIVSAALAEVFEVSVDGQVIGGVSVISADGVFMVAQTLN